MQSKDLHQPKLQRPTNEQFNEIARGLGFHLTETETKDYQKQIDLMMGSLDQLSVIPDDLPQVQYPRTPGYFPSPSENKLNAWYVKCTVKGAPEGKLAGRNVVIKDNICLAGVPMMNGCSVLEGYTPEVDATIVTRILDAGGIIVGKAHCENLCYAGISFTNSKGPVHNPHKMGYTAGGSSSGTGALVGSGEVELGIGGDQGGSIRIPASWCGCYGMKPTHGIVPYTGIMSVEATLDHTGPMTRTVYDNALLLEVIAGPDGLDPRQYIPENLIGDYTSKIKEGVKGMRIGILKEGFGYAFSEKVVDESIRHAVEKFKDLGAIVEEVSVPEHLMAGSAFDGIFYEGTLQNLMLGNGYATGQKGLYIPSMIKALSQWKTHADELPILGKIATILGEYLRKKHNGVIYAKGQNLSRKIRKAYDEAFKKYDIIVMPTMPYLAPKIPEADFDLDSYMQKELTLMANTLVFDCTGHPAMSIPIGKAEDLPIGMTLASKHFNEAEIYKAAYSWEQAVDWTKIIYT